MLNPVIVVLTLGLTFVSVFLAAFHTPQPHRLPVAVVASDRRAALFDVKLQRVAPDAFQVEPYQDEHSAEVALEHRKVYAAYVDTAHDQRLLYAGANGLAVKALVAPLGQATQGPGSKVRVVDVLSLTRDDTRGMSIFYASFGLILAGYLFGRVTYQVAPRPAFSQRLPSLTVFARALIADSIYEAIPGRFVAVAGIVRLMAAAVGAGTVLSIRVFGALGAPVASLFMLVIGNATSGGVLPPSFLPSWLEPLASVMPAGVGVRVLNGLAYFHDDGVASGFTILSVWVGVCALAIFGLDRIASTTAIARAAHRVRPARAR